MWLDGTWGAKFTASVPCHVVTSVPLIIFLFSHLVSSGAFIILLLLSGKHHLLSAQVRHQARAQGVSQNIDCGAEPDTTRLQEDGSIAYHSKNFFPPNKFFISTLPVEQPVNWENCAHSFTRESNRF